MERVTIDDGVFAHNQVSRGEEGASSFVLVLLDFEELSFREPTVLLILLIDSQSVIIEEKDNNEPPLHIFWLVSVQSGSESQLHLIVHPFEVVLLGRLRHQSVHIAKRVFFISESIVRRNNDI